MAQEERQPLVIHPNPNWGATNRRPPVESSGEYTRINPSVRGIHVNHDLSNSFNASALSGASASTVTSSTKSRKSKARTRKHDCNCKLYGASGTILICVILERLAFYGLLGNLVLFLNKFPFFWESYNAMNASFLFSGITYIMSLIGGWLADSLLGRFKTLILAFGIYLCGMLVMPFLAEQTSVNATQILPTICSSNRSKPNGDEDLEPFEERCSWLIYSTLIIISIGCGALKANICPFGSDQFAGESANFQFSFFNWYYWCVNIGSILAFSVVAYVEQQYNFQIGFIICTASLGLAYIIFFSGRYFYKVRPPDGSVLTNIFHIIRVAWRNKRQRKREQKLNDRIAEKRKGPISLFYIILGLSLIFVMSATAMTHTLQELFPSIHEVAATQENISFLDYAKHQFGGIYHSSLVDDVKKLKLILAVFSVSIPYWLVYFQMQTTFVFQGLHMRLRTTGNPKDMNTSNRSDTGDFGDHEEKDVVLVAAWFTLFDAATVIVLLPLFDRFIYPYFERKGYRFTFAKRILLGMFFALVAMVVAGVVEHFRLQAYWPYPDKPCVSRVIDQVIGSTTYNASDMYIFWQIPQYVLIGVSEVFASVACLQFAVSVSPKSMKAVITGLYYMFTGIGSFMGTAIISTLSSSKIWFYDRNFGNINCRYPCKHNTDVEHSCHLDYYFYLLAGLELIAILLFMLIFYIFDLNRVELLLNARAGEPQIRSASGHVQKGKNRPTKS